jgi:hypothetical protein
MFASIVLAQRKAGWRAAARSEPVICRSLANALLDVTSGGRRGTVLPPRDIRRLWRIEHSGKLTSNLRDFNRFIADDDQLLGR